jgi:hypothetical protein
MTNETGAPAPEAQATQEAPAAQVDVREAAIAKLQAHLDGKQDAAPEAGKEEAKAVEAPAASEQPAAEASTEAKAEVPGESPESDVPLTARQRAALFRQEQALLKQKRELEAKENEWKTKESTFLEKLANSPVETLKQFGIDNPAALAELIWNESLGDKAPPEYKQQAQARLLAQKAKQVEELAKPENIQKTVQEAVQQAIMTDRANAKEVEIQAFLRAVPEDMKFLARRAEKTPEAVTQAFYEVAIDQFNKGNFNFTAADIGRALNAEIEAEFSQFKDFIAGPSQSDSPPVDTRQTTKTLMAPETVEKPSKQLMGPTDDPDFYTKRGVAVLEAILNKQRK